MKTILSIIFWVFTIFFALAGIAFLPDVAGIFGLLAAAVSLPLFSWKKQLDNYFTLPVRIIVIALFAFLMFYTAPDVGEKNISGDVKEKIEDTDDEREEKKDSDKASEKSDSSNKDDDSDDTDNEDEDAPQTVVAQGVPDANQGHVHTFAEATCTLPKTCTECNATEGHPIPHDFSEGLCVFCSVSEADTVMVWIPMHGGEKYHSNEDCSNMKEPSYVSKVYAESNGFDACKRCY